MTTEDQKTGHGDGDYDDGDDDDDGNDGDKSAIMTQETCPTYAGSCQTHSDLPW